MVFNQEENGLRRLVFEDGCFKDECPDTESKDSVDTDDSESFTSCDDIADLLPNDPFGMEFNMGLPNDPFGMDINLGLPMDPFGMDFDMATVAAITGWVGDFAFKTYGFEIEDTSEDEKSDDNEMVAELNFVWAGLMNFEPEEEEYLVGDSGYMTQSEDGPYSPCYILKEETWFGSEKYQNEHLNEDYGDSDGGAPADALFFALGHLGVMDLLSVEKVCKSLRDAVQNDPLLWRHIEIDKPLSDKITDDHLVRLTKRAQGTLRSLSLISCSKITNDGLKHVLSSNLGLTKLSVPGCRKLRVEGILQDLKLFNSVGVPGIKHLRIGDILDVTEEYFKEFKLLLGVDEEKRSNYKPRFYCGEQLYLSLDDERAIDIETCPKCNQVRQVYDCPGEFCGQVKPHSPQKCRACTICVARCGSCGCCLDNTEYEETFCLDCICFKCVRLFFRHQDKVLRHQRYQVSIWMMRN